MGVLLARWNPIQHGGIGTRA